MDLTPRHIQEKQFHDAFRGYNHEEVDMFLDEVADAFERVFRENQSLLHKFRQIEEQLGEAKGSEDMLKRMLLTAQKTAEEAIEEARSKAQGMVVAAERKAQETVANADRRGLEIVAEAQTKERELQVNLEGLKRFDAEYRARLKAFIESQLRVLGEGPIGARETSAQTAAQPQASPRPTAEPTGPPPSPVESVPAEKTPDAPPAKEESQPEAVPVGAGKGARGASEPQEDDEDRTIKELFWGDE